eukprot:3714845-Prymnesium_polylepis.1
MCIRDRPQPWVEGAADSTRQCHSSPALSAVQVATAASEQCSRGGRAQRQPLRAPHRHSCTCQCRSPSSETIGGASHTSGRRLPCTGAPPAGVCVPATSRSTRARSWYARSSPPR